MTTLLVRALVLVTVMTSCTTKMQAQLSTKIPATESASKSNCSDVCQTEECISTAARILESLDTRTDPCDDFYQFACGGWVKGQIIRPDRWRLRADYNLDKHLASARNLLTEQPKPSDLTSVRKAKDLYASCILHFSLTETKSNEVDTMVELIKSRFGTWPLTVKNSGNHKINLDDLLTKALYLGVHPLIRLEVGTDVKYDAHGKLVYKHALKLKTPDFGLPAEVLVDKSEKDMIVKMYANKIMADAERFGIEYHHSAKRNAYQIVQIEKTLAGMLNKHPDDGDDEQWNCTLSELDSKYGKLFNWTRFVTKLASSPKIGITDITPDEIVLIEDPAYLSNMTEYFNQLSPRAQANYIIWQVLNSLESVLVTNDNKVSEIMNHAVNGTTARPSADESCILHVSSAFKLVLHRLLYADKFPPEEMKMVNIMLKHIQREFDEVIAEHDWVDNHTARLISEKNAALSTKLVHFEQAMNDSFLEKFYANVTVDKNNFMQNVLMQREEAFARNFRLLRKPFELTFEELPHEIVAQNNYIEHQMEYSSVVFEPPFFTHGIPQSMNYGGMGAVFGHEIIHSFDNDGFAWNKEGIQGSWWNNETVSKFRERHHCLVAQYSDFYYDKAGMYIDGNLTLSENIADNSGLKLAYRAYQKHVSKKQKELTLPGVHYSDAQLFFINFAQTWCIVENKEAAMASMNDTHSPSEYRVKGTLQNSPDFARDFSCPDGSYMNPKTKCEVW